MANLFNDRQTGPFWKPFLYFALFLYLGMLAASRHLPDFLFPFRDIFSKKTELYRPEPDSPGPAGPSAPGESNPAPTDMPSSPDPGLTPPTSQQPAPGKTI